MLITNKMLAVVLIAALSGGTLGAILMRHQDATLTEPTNTANATYPTDQNSNAVLTGAATDTAYVANVRASGFKTAEEQTAYKVGFADGVLQANQKGATQVNGSARRASYNHAEARRGRSFWSKHRDKLTVAMGTGGGALLGALVGGGKGAGIGALAGAGGSALYTYKLRKRH